jgi:integrase/recombinase XerD
MLLSESWRLYAADKHLLGYSPITLTNYKLQVDLLIRGIGDLDLEEIKTEELKGYLASQTQLKPSSLGMRIRSLRSLFHWASDEGYLPKNPASRLKEPKLGDRIPKALSDEDMERLRQACITPFEHSLIEFFAATGCRIGEIYRLDRDDINWTDRGCVVLGKGNKERPVFFDVPTAVWLQKYLAERKDIDPALFVTRRAPHRMSISQIRYVVKQIAKRAEIRVNVFPHALRHTFAMEMLNGDAPMDLVRELLGHNDLRTTRIYARLTKESMRNQYRRYRH